MWPASYFTRSFWPSRYWVKSGLLPATGPSVIDIVGEYAPVIDIVGSVDGD